MNRRVTLAVAAVSATALAFAPAWGASRTTQSESFFASGNASAHWDNTQSSDNDPFSEVYTVNDATSYAGTYLHHVEDAPPPPNSPTFDYKADRSGPSDGSPRLVMVFGDPTTGAEIGDIELTPDNWDTNWQPAGDGQWSAHLGSCGFTYHDTYAHAVSCMDGGIVTDVFMVSDSGFAYPTGYKNWVDNIQYGGKTVSQPADNNNS